MLKDLGARAFGYGMPMPIFMVASYNDDDSVNVMNLHETSRTNAGNLALFIGPYGKTISNIKKRKTFSITLVHPEMMSAADLFGSISGKRVPNKFEISGLTAHKSSYTGAPIIEGSRLVIECELIDMIHQGNFATVHARVINVAADDSVLDDRGHVDMTKVNPIFFDSFSNGYFEIGDRVGNAWKEGVKILKK